MTTESSERCVLVTGAARGIGFAVAAAFHEAGFKVAACDLDAAGLEPLRKRFEGSDRLLTLGCDIADTGAVEEMVQTAADRMGPVSILVNNAGILVTEKLVDTSDREIDDILRINVGGTMKVSRTVLPDMLKQGWGRVISLASITPIRGEARTSAYAASKGAVIGFSKSLSREVAHRGVTVNAVAPGYVSTDMNAEVFSGEVGDQVRSQITIRDFGTPSDVASAVTYLASDDARYVTGHVLVVDGGVV